MVVHCVPKLQSSFRGDLMLTAIFANLKDICGYSSITFFGNVIHGALNLAKYCLIFRRE